MSTYSKAIKTRALPKISKATWPRFLSLWDSEKAKYSTDDARVSILRHHLTDTNDLQAADLHVTVEALETYLMRRYGAQSIILSTLLSDLITKNKSPKHDVEEENACNRLRNLTSYFKTGEHYKLLSILKITEILDVTFQKDNKTQFWERFFQLKHTITKNYISLHPDTSPTEAEEIFEVDYGMQKLQLIEEFTDMRIEVLRQLNTSASSPAGHPSTSRGRGSSRVTDGRERWRCPVCKTQHQNPRQAVRPYLSCCPVFLEMDVSGRVNTVKKFGYCRLCLADASKGHEDQCPRLEMFKCKHCEHPKCNSHCSLLCFKNQGGAPPRQGDSSRHQDGGGGDGGSRGRRGRGTGSGRGRGQGRGESRRAHQNDQTDQSGSGRSKNVQWYYLQQNQNFDILVKNTKNKHPRTILQPITSVDIDVQSTLRRVLCLADTGSTIAFLVKKFAQKLEIEPIGTWCGSIATLYATQEVESNFYKLQIVLSDNSNRDILALECDSLGNRVALPMWLVEKVCKEFQHDTKKVLRAAGGIILLLGQDTQELLLNRLPNKTQNPYFKDISLQASVTSPFTSIVGALGDGASLDSPGNIFKTTVLDGAFCLTHADPDILNLITASPWKSSTIKVRKQILNPAYPIQNGPPPPPGPPGPGPSPPGPPAPPPGASPAGQSSSTASDPNSSSSQSHTESSNFSALQSYFNQRSSKLTFSLFWTIAIFQMLSSSFILQNPRLPSQVQEDSLILNFISRNPHRDPRDPHGHSGLNSEKIKNKLFNYSK